MWKTAKLTVSKSWRILWIIWSLVITATLIIAIASVVILEWRARRSLDPDQMSLMPAPTLIADNVVDPFENANPQEVTTGIGVFYATDRAPATEADDQKYYRNARGDALRLGVSRVAIGESIENWQELKQISLSREREREYLMRVSEAREFGPLPESIHPFSEAVLGERERQAARQYAEEINAKLANSRHKDVFIYVHGYKVVFENPLLLATELWHYMGYQGVMIAYAWPSTPDFLAYASDLETTRYSARHLRLLIDFLSSETDAEQIHVLGYSAGTGLVLSMLEEMALQHLPDSKETVQERYRVGQVILVCSDVDRGIFINQLVDGIWKVPEQLNIYVSEVDATLGMSQLVFRRRRLGRLFEDDQFSERMTKFFQEQSQINLIDVSNAENVSANNGHAYFHKSPWVSSDVLLTLAMKRPPADRGLVRRPGTPFWYFESDYPERLKQLDLGNDQNGGTEHDVNPPDSR